MKFGLIYNTPSGSARCPVKPKPSGSDFRTRGARADEAIDVLRLLWAAWSGCVRCPNKPPPGTR